MYELEHTELSEKVYHLVKKMILNREFAGGQRLDMNELAQRMKISRTPLKDAVNRLVTEGLMEIKPRSGTFVTSVTIPDIEEVTEIRLMMEEWCVSHLTQVKAAALVEALEANLLEALRLLSSEPFPFQEYLELDVQFHNHIIRSTGNPRMLAQYRSLNSFLHISRIYHFQSFERSSIGYKQHMAVTDAIRKYDLDTAKRLLREHILGSRDNMVEHLEKSGGKL